MANFNRKIEKAKGKKEEEFSETITYVDESYEMRCGSSGIHIVVGAINKKFIDNPKVVVDYNQDLLSYYVKFQSFFESDDLIEFLKIHIENTIEDNSLIMIEDLEVHDTNKIVLSEKIMNENFLPNFRGHFTLSTGYMCISFSSYLIIVDIYSRKIYKYYEV